MLFKLKSPNLHPLQNSFTDEWIISISIHSALVLLALLTFFASKIQRTSSLDIQIIESPKLATHVVPIFQAKPPPKKPKVREVFGISRRAASIDSGENVKQGNTVAKTPDTTQLKSNDPDTLPIPSEEYLITKMPELKSEVRIPYPAESKKKGIQGAVVMDLLIDANGKVREVTLVEGPNSELNDAAVAAAKNFQFTAAMIEDKPVAVRIRYAYRFVLGF